MVFTHRAWDYSKNLTRSINYYWFIFCICWYEFQYISFLLEVLQCNISIKRSNHYISVMRSKGSIKYYYISLLYPCIYHTISFHFHEKSTRRMFDKILLQVHLRSRLSLRGEWKSCTNRFKEWIPDKSICRDISSFFHTEYIEFYKLLKKSLSSSGVSISKKFTHLVEWMIDSSTTKEFTKRIDLVLIVFIWSHSLYIFIYKLYSEL